jgi:hypothetical protein
MEEVAESCSDTDSNSSDSTSDSSGSEDESQADPAKQAVNVHERRTRRGVYAIVQEEDDESEESDDEEGNLPLAHAPDVPADGEIELEAAAYNGSGLTSLSSSRSPSQNEAVDVPEALLVPANGRSTATHLGLDTPPPSEDAEGEGDTAALSDHTSLPGSGRSSHTVDTDEKGLKPPLTGESPSSTEEPALSEGELRRQARGALWDRIAKQVARVKPDEWQTELLRSLYRSEVKRLRLNTPPPPAPRRITRSLSAIQHLATPPLSEDAASLPDTASSTSTRITRQRSSTLSPKERANGKESERDKTSPRLPTPTKGKGKEKADEESEARVLRARPSLPASRDEVTPQPTKPVVRRGPDGKALPICSTCCNVLPVISVDSKVIWGMDTSPQKGKKRKEKQECPRFVCLLKRRNSTM